LTSFSFLFFLRIMIIQNFPSISTTRFI